MAVYYKWIKGCSEGSTLTSGLWSYVKWGSGGASTYVDNLPTLYTDTGKSDSGQENNLGYFLTNNVNGVEINKTWSFIDWTTTPERRLDIKGPTFSSNTGEKINFDSRVVFNGGLDSLGDVILKQNIDQDSLECQMQSFLCKQTTIGNGKAIIEDGEYMLGVAGKIKTNDSVHAPYFNATSDMRAKENIKKLPFSALAFISNLNVYQFNYKGKNDTIPGVLAQDVLNSQPEGLSLVDNIDASGENGDYMSIKEDKFIFLLMRAVQELKEDNDALRYEIEQLKQKLK